MERVKRIGFMSQVSPDGAMSSRPPQFSISSPTSPTTGSFRSSTRRAASWLVRPQDGQIRPLPGADDPQYVQSNAVWSPDKQCPAFVRAKAIDAYQRGKPGATYANDPNEPQIKYDIYKIPFNDGAEEPGAVRGPRRTGYEANSFPRISPDGKWVVFVQAKNGQLMRPTANSSSSRPLEALPAACAPTRRG